MKLLSRFTVALAALLLTLPAQADKKKAAENLEDARHAPGVVTGGRAAPHIKGTWLRGTDGNAGVIPAQIATKMKGQKFENFDQFRQAFWKAAAATTDLNAQFIKANQTLMAKGLAPAAAKSQQVGGRRSYELHHKTPVHLAGELYNLDNLLVVTPRYHQEFLDPAVHYGSKGGK